MPIELWWWLKPLYQTSILWLILFGGIAGLTKSKSGEILAVIAIAPLAVCIASSIMWFLMNVLIWIWR